MLDKETKRRIDSARDILVGKVPDPKSQVEQITIALIYKFMDDMDLESEELGGERSFFKGEFEKYAWRKIFDPRMGGFEILNLYSEAILKMNVNPNIPQLFRDIFKNAYLPYRDPETLKSFLKIIHEFSYDHSEQLGDAFEYLLSVLGSQGDAGQFRTPRHIIDFMVSIIDPKKGEIIMDPACGTAGFLISSYKHILKHNSSNYDPKTDTRTFETKDLSLSELIINSKNYKGDKLTPDERSRLAKNIKGYDISADMVRLSLANMYLHGLHAPQIAEYDTLTSEENWNEYADVILANPPFMSPKGGIRPHKRFSVSSNRSEVLFVDYIAEHLTSNGRAAVIVPEGIIFQSGTAYKSLRKMLVENYLVGVISLPAGVFQPYSGVKTSILWLEKTLAKKTDKILFVKVENDGFDLGAQRRTIKYNDLPYIFQIISKYKKQIVSNELVDFELGKNISIVARNVISANEDFNLSGERYKKPITYSGKYLKTKIKDIGAVESGFGFSLEKHGDNTKPIPFYKVSDMNLPGNEIFMRAQNNTIDLKDLKDLKAKTFPPNTIIFPKIGAAIATNKKRIITKDAVVDNNVMGIIPNEAVINSLYLFSILQSIDISIWASEAQPPSMKKSTVEEFEIPIPPLSIQIEIVSEIESYQKIINGARQVVENYKPRIDIDPEWEMVDLGEIAEFKNGLNYQKGEVGEKLKLLGVRHFQNNLIAPVSDIDEINLDNEIKPDYLLNEGDLLFVRSNGNIELVGRSIIIPKIDQRITFSGFTIRCRFQKDVYPLFYAYLFKTPYFRNILKDLGRGANISNLTQVILSGVRVPKPDKNYQISIVKKLQSEQILIDASQELIRIYKDKIKDRIAKVWGE